MKIAIVYDALYPCKIGGVEKRIWEVSTRLVKRGHEIHLYCVKFWSGEDTIEKEGVIIHGITRFRPFYNDKRRKILPAIIYSLRLFKPLLLGSFDLIVSHQFPYFSCIPAKFASLIKKIPLIIVWHELWENYWYEYLGLPGIIGKTLEYSSLFMSEYIIPVSLTTQRKIKRVRREFRVIPNGIDFNQIYSIHPSGITSDIIFIGRLIREKNLLLLIEAIELLSHSPHPVRCVILGDGPQRFILKDSGKELEKRGYLLFLSENHSYESVIGLLKASKIFVSPSIREGFGMAALEALASGLPVVTVEHPDNAVCNFISTDTGLISKNDPHSFAIAIQECMKTYQFKKQSCMDYARKFDWKEIVDLIEAVYSEINKNRDIKSSGLK